MTDVICSELALDLFLGVKLFWRHDPGVIDYDVERGCDI